MAIIDKTQYCKKLKIKLMKKYKTKLFAQLSTQSGKRKKTYCQKLFNRFKQQNVYLTMCNDFYFNVYLKNLSQHTVEVLRKVSHI